MECVGIKRQLMKPVMYPLQTNSFSFSSNMCQCAIQKGIHR